MAEKSTKKVAKPANAPETPKPVEAVKVTKAPKITTVDKFHFLKAVSPEDKLAPQARTIVNVLSEHKDGLSRADLVTALTGKLNTRQPEGRILTYYQKLLTERGHLKIEETEVVAPAEDTTETAAAGTETAAAGTESAAAE